MPGPQSLPARIASFLRRHLALLLIGAGVLVATVKSPTRGPAVDAGDVPRGFEAVGFQHLGGYETGEGEWGELPSSVDVPRRIREMDGRLVYMKGFMLPLEGDERGITRFVLNAAQDMCYYGAPVKLNEWVLVSLPAARPAEYSHLPISVWGRLSVGEEKREGKVVSLYRLEAEDSKAAF